MIEIFETVQMVIISALVGGLIGIERERKENVLAGSRTFMLLSVFGTFSVLISEQLEIPGFISAAFIGVALIAALVGYIKNIKLDDVGITTSIAMLVAFILGIFIGQGLFFEGLAGSVIVSLILVSKYYLRNLTDNLTHEEFINALEFGVIAFVLYPIVPDTPIDPFGVLNPRVLVLVVILVSTMGFFGFLSLRKLGASKGLAVVGALGSMVNSKATIASLAENAKRNKFFNDPVVAGIMLSGIVMLIRNLIIAGFLSFDVLKFMLVPQLLMALAGLIYFALKPLDGKDTGFQEPHVSSPFAIIPAVKFALLFLAISLIVKNVQGAGVGGVYIAVVLGSVVSSAAVIASLVSMHSLGSISLVTAASASVISSIISLLSMILIVRVNGTFELVKKVAAPLTILALIGVASLILMAII